MRYSDYFDLMHKQQEDLDFFNGLVNFDSPLYIDPALIELEREEWFKETSKIIESFFNHIFYLHFEGYFEEARDLLDYGSEPNEIRLGLSTGKPQGRGSSQKQLVDIFRDIESNGLLDEGLITDYKDLTIFVKGFGEDRMSDLIANIIRGQLTAYTIEQSIRHGMPLTENVQEIGMAWNKDKLEWETIDDYALLARGSLLLLIPKKIVVKRYLHSVENYLTRTVLNWRQEYHKDNGTSLAQRIPLKDRPGYRIKEPTKKDIKEKEIQDRKLTEKEYVTEQSRENKSLISRFHKKSRHGFDSHWTNRLTDEELEEVVQETEIYRK